MAGSVTVAAGVVKCYSETEAPAGLDLAVATGTVLGLLGPSGGREDHRGGQRRVSA